MSSQVAAGPDLPLPVVSVRELTAERKLIFDQQLALCADCVAYMDNYKSAIGLLPDKSLPAGSDVPADIPQLHIDAILAAQPK